MFNTYYDTSGALHIHISGPSQHSVEDRLSDMYEYILFVDSLINDGEYHGHYVSI